jgi:DNA-binding MarR family transcriptional regulator
LDKASRLAKGLWPYVLPLPTSTSRQTRLILSVFKSEASMNLVKHVPLDKEAYQKELIRTLGYSNKTVIKWLRSLVTAGILKEEMKETTVKGRRVWVKSYRLTSLGKWIRLLLIAPRQLPAERIRELIRDLFGLYVKSVAALSKRYGISVSVLKRDFEDALSGGRNVPSVSEE